MPHQLALLPAQDTSDLVASFRLSLGGLRPSDFVTQLAFAIVDDVSALCTLAALPSPAVPLLRLVADITVLVCAMNGHEGDHGRFDDLCLYWAAHTIKRARTDIRLLLLPIDHRHAVAAANLAVLSLARTEQALRHSQMLGDPDSDSENEMPPYFVLVGQWRHGPMPPVFVLVPFPPLYPESADVSTASSDGGMDLVEDSDDSA